MSGAGVKGAALLAITATIINIFVSQTPKMEHGVPLLRLPPLPPPSSGISLFHHTTTYHCHLPATTTTQDNRTALHWASLRGHAGVMGLLLGTPLMTEDCFNAKTSVSGGWWWGVGAVVVTAVLVLVVVAVE